MNVFAPARAITVQIPFVDSMGEMVVPTALRYRVLDEAGAEIATWVDVPVVDLDNDFARITVTAGQNSLAAGVVQGFRRVELEITHDAGVDFGHEDYILEAKNVLVTGLNSFQTYEQALLTARNLGPMAGWDKASDTDRKRAMLQAFTQLQSFSYVIHYTDGTAATEVLDDLETADWALIELGQMTNFRKAQVMQADFNLGGNHIEKAIADGLQSTTIGEVSQFFRPRASLVMPICRAALNLVGQYINWQPKSGRA